jgi:putative CocE/NonD family hydrolase
MVKKWVGILVIFILLLLLAFYHLPTGAPEPVLIETRTVVTPTLLPRTSIEDIDKAYTYPLYSEFTKTSLSIPLRDGTRLAAEIFRPAPARKPWRTHYPVIWMTSQTFHDEELDFYTGITKIVLYGYILGVVEGRGSAASNGDVQPELNLEELQDDYDITEWFAAQPWSDGHIGMYSSACGVDNQSNSASIIPLHLKAILLMGACFDGYSYYYPGGIFYDPELATSREKVKASVASSQPADVGREGPTIQQHQSDEDVSLYYSSLPYRDSLDLETSLRPFLDYYAPGILKPIDDSGVAIYNWGGWNDITVRDTFLWYKNLTNPRKIFIGPGVHDQGSGTISSFDEQRRWFDYWLKGFNNGIMDEPPITYYTLGAGTRAGWHTARQWPLPEQKLTNYYFNSGPSRSVHSVNDGLLSQAMPADPEAKDIYTIDYSTGSGPSSRWAFSSDQDLRLPDQNLNDTKGLTYTTPPLTSPLEVTGYPIVHFWITSTAQDGDFFVSLEDVNERGNSYKITEGMLRASHRNLAPAPYDNLGLPYHRSYAADIAPLPRVPVELVFDLLPTSYVFDAGHHLRITITCAEKDAFVTPHIDPPPTITLYRDADHPSYVVLPIIP